MSFSIRRINNRLDSFSKPYTLLCLILVGMGMYEGVYGLLQICGVLESGHNSYYSTGTFYNPGPYACFLSLILPIAVECSRLQNKIIKILSYVYIISCIIILPSTLSRTGWICGIAGVTVTFLPWIKHRLKSLTSSRRCILLLIISAFLISILLLLYCYKQSSADGRFLIWKIAVRAIAGNPLLGCGWEKVAGVYGIYQELYFMGGNGSSYEEYLAGTPSYLYNEYLQLALAFGIPFSMMFVIVLVKMFMVSIRSKMYGLCGLIVAFGIVCSTSYPLQFVEFKLVMLITLCFVALAIHNILERSIWFFISFGMSMLLLENTGKDVDMRLYENALLEREAGHYDTSNDLLQALLMTTSDPMPLNLIGDNYLAIGARDSAELYYRKAHYRVPNRLYPHYKLMKMYLEEPMDQESAVEQARILISKKPKVKSIAANEMRVEASVVIGGRNITDE